MLRKLVVPLVVAALCGTTATAAQASAGDDRHGLAGVMRATARYHSVEVAEEAGYGRFVDVNDVACIAMPGMGAMGIHYVNGDLVGDPRIAALQPEAMV